MRPVIWADVLAAAVWLAGMPVARQAAALEAALAAARVADGYRKRLRRRHRRLGDGSLAAAVAGLGGRGAMREPVLDDPALCAAAALVLARLAVRGRAHRQRRGAGRRARHRYMQPSTSTGGPPPCRTDPHVR